MPAKPYLGRYVVLTGLQKVADAGASDSHFLCPRSGQRLRNRVRIEGIPEFPRYTMGLDVGAIYAWRSKSDVPVIDGELGFYTFLAKLGELVEHDWRAENPSGRPGAFFELLRYGLQRAHLSGRAAAKLAHDFDDWEMRVEALGDAEFLNQFRTLGDLVYSATRGALYFDGVPEPEPYDFRRLTGLLRNGCGDDDLI